METRCKDTSENVLGRKINWRPDGKELLVFGAKPDGSELGMIRYVSERPFSADPADWESKGFGTDVTQAPPGRARRRATRPTASSSRSWCWTATARRTCS